MKKDLTASIKKGASIAANIDNDDPNKGVRGDIEEEDVEESYYR